MNCGIDIDRLNFSSLLSADAIVKIASDEEKLQVMLDFIQESCGKWKMLVNNKNIDFHP